MTENSIISKINEAERNEADYVKFYIEDECQVIKNSLEKQIPKKPILEKRAIPCCSVCGGIMDLMQGELNYCPNCGQRLLWEDENDE